MRLHAISGLCCGFFTGGLLLPASSEGAMPVQDFLKEHCIKCHNEEKAKGDLRLDNLKPQFDRRETLTVWQHVLEKMETGEMPPKAKPRPPAKELREAADWIADQVKVASAKLRETEGRVVLRRLNRNEYENTVRDLLGVEVKLREMLPQDAAAAGFDNVGMLCTPLRFCWPSIWRRQKRRSTRRLPTVRSRRLRQSV